MKFLFVLLAAGAMTFGCGGKDKAKGGDKAGKAELNLHDAGEPGDAKKGEAVYMKTCKACHQKDGRGMNGSLAADFRSDPRRLQKPDSVLLKSITEGKKGEKLQMPPQAPALSAVEIKDALAYVRDRFGKKKKKKK